MSRSAPSVAHTRFRKNSKLSDSLSYSPASNHQIPRRDPNCSRRLLSRETDFVVLIMILTLMTVSCFGTAYYLFCTSDRGSVDIIRTSQQQQPHIDLLQDIVPNDQSAYEEGVGERFLSYLPHSGFHNQRIALENALVLSHLLNRTLLVPPIRLGRKAISYAHFSRLEAIVGDDFLPPTCEDGYKRDVLWGKGCIPKKKSDIHTYLPWDWLTDFSKTKLELKVIERWNLSSEWISSELKIHPSDIFSLIDTTLYHYRFVEDQDSVFIPDGSSYQESIVISSLINHPAKLIQLGSLFGSSRLAISHPNTRMLRKTIRQNMVLSQPILATISDQIRDYFGGEYLGAHIRINDWFFSRRADTNTRMIWWKLVHGLLNISVEDAADLERKYARYTIPDSPTDIRLFSVPKSQRLHPFNSTDPPPYPVECREKLHTKTHLLQLNTPLLISTDAKDPHKNRYLSVFRQTFPCVFFLQDFSSHLELLKELRSPLDDDEFSLSSFMVPFLDAMMVAKAKRVVGTKHSTFSWFVQDILWRRYHGMDINERAQRSLRQS